MSLHNDKEKKKSEGIISTIVDVVFGGGLTDRAAKALKEREKKRKKAEKEAGA